MKNDILLVGKIIQKEEKQKLYIVLLLCDSNVNVECSFKESQIEEYLICKKNENKAKLNMINNNVRDVDQSDNYSTDQGSDHSFVKNDTIRDDAIHNETEDDSDSHSDEDSEYESDVNVIQPETVSESSDSSFSDYSPKKSKKPIAKKLPKKTTKTAKKNPPTKAKRVACTPTKKTQKKTSSSDSLIGLRVAFEFHNEDFQNKLKQVMGKNYTDKYDNKICCERDKYVFGYVTKKNTKNKSDDSFPYTVAWEFSGGSIKEMTFTMKEIVEAYGKAIQLDNNKERTIHNSMKSNLSTNERLNKLFRFDPNDVEGSAIESDESDSDDEDHCNKIEQRIKNGTFFKVSKRLSFGGCKNHFVTDETLNCHNLISKENNGSLEIKDADTYLNENGGLLWKKNKDLERPQGIRPETKTHLKEDTKHMFRTELESFLALVPMRFWVHHLHETNRYMKEEYAKKVSKNSNSKNSYKEVKINELMVFYAIIFQMAMKPNPGSRYTSCWSESNKKWYTACQHMSRKRFMEIRQSLHWVNNQMTQFTSTDPETGKLDTLYKIRPFLNMMDFTFKKYVEPGTELSLDETCVAIHSMWARALTFYNPMKPKGKHHLKFYTLCENDSWCCLVLKMCFRFKKQQKNSEEKDDTSKDDTTNESKVLESDDEDDAGDDNESDHNLSDFDEGNEIVDSDVENNFLFKKLGGSNSNSKTQNEKMAQKTVQTVTDLCRSYKGSGRVINMDNLYTSPLVFLKLKEMGLYARGTVRTTRKYLPRFIKYLKKDTKHLKRGSYQYAVNEPSGMSMHCWNDNHPVHVLSTADSTHVDVVSRKTGKDKIEVACPETIKNYNKNMQAVDQFNKLMSLFSLSNAHTFTKYYKKVAMVLMDFCLVNAYLHHKLYVESENISTNKKSCAPDRKVFMEKLIHAMLHTDFSIMAREQERVIENMKKKDNGNNEESFSDDEISHDSSIHDPHFFDEDEDDYDDIHKNESESGFTKEHETNIHNGVLLCQAVSLDTVHKFNKESPNRF